MIRLTDDFSITLRDGRRFAASFSEADEYPTVINMSIRERASVDAVVGWLGRGELVAELLSLLPNESNDPAIERVLLAMPKASVKTRAPAFKLTEVLRTYDPLSEEFCKLHGVNRFRLDQYLACGLVRYEGAHESALYNFVGGLDIDSADAALRSIIAVSGEPLKMTPSQLMESASKMFQSIGATAEKVLGALGAMGEALAQAGSNCKRFMDETDEEYAKRLVGKFKS